MRQLIVLALAALMALLSFVPPVLPAVPSVETTYAAAPTCRNPFDRKGNKCINGGGHTTNFKPEHHKGK
jgi:hypothetical protein